MNMIVIRVVRRAKTVTFSEAAEFYLFSQKQQRAHKRPNPSTSRRDGITSVQLRTRKIFTLASSCMRHSHKNKKQNIATQSKHFAFFFFAGTSDIAHNTSGKNIRKLA